MSDRIPDHVSSEDGLLWLTVNGQKIMAHHAKGLPPEMLALLRRQMDLNLAMGRNVIFLSGSISPPRRPRRSPS